MTDPHNKAARRLALTPKRCAGDCCKRFSIHSHGVEEKLDAAKVKAAIHLSGNQEAAFVADMLLPFYGPAERNHQTMYTCRHFDGHDCEVYEYRPQLCRRYGTEEQKCDQSVCSARPERPLERLRWIERLMSGDLYAEKPEVQEATEAQEPDKAVCEVGASS